jgi:predicted enzyme related to lactoylglutathione lyase
MDRRRLLKSLAAGVALSPLGRTWAAPAMGLRDQIMGIGWCVVFSRPSLIDRMTEFYGSTLGLPLLMTMRGPLQNKNYFWCGEDIVLDLAHHALEIPLDPREADPATARQIPIFRTDDLAALVAQLTAQGATVLPPRSTPQGDEAFVVDPMGRLIGYRQRPADSTFPPDVEARRRLRRGEAFNPGCAAMPAHLQELGWVRLSVADPAAARRFYGDLLGLADLGREGTADRFDLGDNSVLEIVPGGVARPAPAEQRASETVTILRVVDFPTVRARLEAMGQPLPYKIYDMAMGGFTYIADGEGNLLGLADRKPPAAYIAKEPARAEDLEARRRWVEATSGH